MMLNRQFVSKFFLKIVVIFLLVFCFFENLKYFSAYTKLKDFQQNFGRPTEILIVREVQPEAVIAEDEMLILPAEDVTPANTKFKLTTKSITKAMSEPKEKINPDYFKLENVNEDTEVEKDTTTVLNLDQEQIDLIAKAKKLKERKKLLNCKDRPLIFERLQHGRFWVLKNFIRATKTLEMGCAESITYTTNGDYTFFDNLPILVSRWLAPISFAIFAPGDDMDATLKSIQFARNCIAESDLIQQYVTFHLFFPNKHMFQNMPHNDKEALAYPFNCTEVAPYENVKREEMYKAKANLTYPINVGRNIARKAANTHFIFPCDIELFPNYGLVEKFLDLVDRNSSEILKSEKPRVFPMPVFEIQENTTIPDTKTELLQMLKDKSAVPFHYRVCKSCHLVPNQKEWLSLNDSESLSLFRIGKRVKEFVYWEPFYISDNTEPFFDERVTWEGQSNKRVQNFAMCLLDYEYYILHPAFLVHRPGIKVFKFTKRMKYVAEMNKFIRAQIDPEYRILFGNNTMCRT